MLPYRDDLVFAFFLATSHLKAAGKLKAHLIKQNGCPRESRR